MLGLALFIQFCLVLGVENNNNATDLDITCNDFKKLSAGLVLYYTQSLTDATPDINIYLSTGRRKTPTVINPIDASSIKQVSLDPTKETYFIIHGFKASAKSEWIEELKCKLLDTLFHARVGPNVFVIDWSNGGNRFNYVNAARNTQVASLQIVLFLQKLKLTINDKKKDHSVNKWNRLYFVGHSLGAHVSGQIGHLLKRDDFWLVKRITGLDPARPCFIDIDYDLKIDKDDADLVDIIHTQTQGDYAFGLKERLGHIDIYVNGGAIQPECNNRFFTTELTRMICSHRLSYTYFIESLDSNVTRTCRFRCYPWDGSRASALESLALFISGRSCAKCPVMGFGISESTAHDMYIVFTSLKSPHCDLHLNNLEYLLKSVSAME